MDKESTLGGVETGVHGKRSRQLFRFLFNRPDTPRFLPRQTPRFGFRGDAGSEPAGLPGLPGRSRRDRRSTPVPGCQGPGDLTPGNERKEHREESFGGEHDGLSVVFWMFLGVLDVSVVFWMFLGCFGCFLGVLDVPLIFCWCLKRRLRHQSDGSSTWFHADPKDSMLFFLGRKKGSFCNPFPSWFLRGFRPILEGRAGLANWALTQDMVF